jgi:hypothetical protein
MHLYCVRSKAPRDGHACIICVADSQAALRGILSTAPRSGQHCEVAYDKLVPNAMVARPHLTILNM